MPQLPWCTTTRALSEPLVKAFFKGEVSTASLASFVVVDLISSVSQHNVAQCCVVMADDAFLTLSWDIMPCLHLANFTRKLS